MRMETERLLLSRLDLDDAAFMQRLLNEPSFLEHIGDKGVRTLADAQAHLRDQVLAGYAQHGFGMYKVALKAGGEALGLAGLVRRAGLDGPDLGYAFLPEHGGRGYAREAARAVLEHARRDLGLGRLLAIVNPDNAASIRLLERLGFGGQGCMRLAGEDKDVRLFVLDRLNPAVSAH